MPKLAYKIFESKARIIFALIIVALYIFTLFDIKDAAQLDPYSTQEYAKLYSEPQFIWHTISWLGSRLTILLAILYITIVAPQYSFLSVHDSLQYRKELWRTNYFLAFIISAVWVFLLLISGFILMLTEKGTNTLWFVRMYYLIVVFIAIYGVLLMALISASIAKSTVGAIVIFLGYFLAEALLRKYLSLSDSTAELFFPARVFTRLVPPPSINFGDDNILKNFLQQNPIPLWANVAISAVYIMIFSLLGYKITVKLKHNNHEKQNHTVNSVDNANG